VSCVLVSRPESDRIGDSGKVFQDIEFSSGTGLPIVVASDAVQPELIALHIGFQGFGFSLLMSK